MAKKEKTKEDKEEVNKEINEKDKSGKENINKEKKLNKKLEINKEEVNKEITKKENQSGMETKKDVIPNTKINKEEIKPQKENKFKNVKLFGRWDMNIELKDPGITPYVTLTPKCVPRSAGINQKRRFHKSNMSIIERLALHLMVPGHSGKKHKTCSGHLGGSYSNAIKIVEEAFEKIEAKEKKNPVEVFIRALENAALREEVTSFQIGSIMVRSAVVTAPQRRVDRTLRMFSQGTYQRSHGKKKGAAESLAEELLEAYRSSDKSLAIREKERLEREAGGAR